MKSLIWPVAFVCAVIGLESLALYCALQKEIHNVCGQCQPAECVETQGFGMAEAGDQPASASEETAETPRETNQRGEKQAWLCANQLGGELYRKNTSSNFEPKGLAAFCLLRTLQGVGNETEARITELESKCVSAGGKFVGQTHKLDVMCDLSGVK